MTQLSSPKTVRRGRVFPEKQLSPEEKSRIKAEDAVFYKRCREVFDRVQPELIKDHYDWFIAFPVHKRYILNPEKLNQQRLKCAWQMREPLYYY
jgi:hypothetical protein